MASTDIRKVLTEISNKLTSCTGKFDVKQLLEIQNHLLVMIAQILNSVIQLETWDY